MAPPALTCILQLLLRALWRCAGPLPVTLPACSRHFEKDGAWTQGASVGHPAKPACGSDSTLLDEAGNTMIERSRCA